MKFVNNDDPDYFHAAWLCTILVENRHELEKKLIANGIENGQVHYRNDRYSIFSEYKRNDLNNMNQIESNYLVLPLHSKIDKGDIDRIYDIIKSGW